MSLLMDALKRAETIKQEARHDEETDNIQPLAQRALSTDNVAPSLEKEGNEWEEKLATLDVQEKVEEQEIIESTIMDWTDTLLFDVDDDDTPLQLEETPKEEEVSPPLIWEEAILPEFDDVPVEEESVLIPAEEKPDEPPITLTADEGLTAEIHETVDEPPVVSTPSTVDEALITEIHKSADETIETPVAIEIVDHGEDFTNVPTKDDHLKFTDWIDDYIDEDALRIAHSKNIQVQQEVDKELSLLEKLAEGDATHPNVAKRLLTARGKSPRLSKNTLTLLGVLGVVVIGLGGGFAYYYSALDTGGVRFNKNVRFTSLPAPTEPLSTEATAEEKVAVSEPILETPEPLATPKKTLSEHPATPTAISPSETVETALPSTESPPAIESQLPSKTVETEKTKPTPLVESHAPEKPAPLPSPVESKMQALNQIIESRQKTKPTIPMENPVPEESKPTPPKYDPIQTQAGIHTLRKTTQTMDNTPLSKAYAALQQGDLNTAQRLYTQVLQMQSTNRDALLGLAGIFLQQGQTAKAHYYYQHILELYPQDKFAQIGLINTLDQGGSEQSESHLKLLLNESPQASHIHFSLGNLYARRGQWAQAQQAYFSAYRYNSQHPDYAYNLAVSLDQINQSRLALTYYQKAAQLVQNARVAYHFNPQAMQQRIRTLTAHYQNNKD